MIALSDSGPIAGARRLALGINLAGLGLLIWGVTTEARPGLGGRHLAAVLLLAACAAGWLMWVATRVRPLPTLTAVSLAIMGLAGGALATFAPIALTFVGVSALGATIGWTLEVGGMARCHRPAGHAHLGPCRRAQLARSAAAWPPVWLEPPWVPAAASPRSAPPKPHSCR